MADILKTEEEMEQMETEALEEGQEADLDTGFELEIVDPEAYGKEKSDELVAAESQLEELRAAKLAAENAGTDRQAMTTALESIQSLQKQLAGGINVNQAPSGTQVPKLDYEALKKELNRDLLSDPAAQISKFLSPVINGLNSRIEEIGGSATRANARSELLLNDESRTFYVKYKDEIEEAAKGFNGPDSYKKALNSVKSEHLDEIIEIKVAAKMAEIQPKAKPAFTNVGSPSAPAGPARKQVTPGMNQWMAAMRNKGMADESYLLERATELKKAGSIRG
jgi:hypothetical protein